MKRKLESRKKEELGLVDIKKEVRQGCTLSPDLFNLYSEEAHRKIRVGDVVDLEGKNYNNLR